MARSQSRQFHVFMQMNLEKEIDEWLKSFKEKPYKHFDLIVKSNDYMTGGKLRSDLSDPATLQTYKFWPFLRFDDKQRRFRKNLKNNLIIDEKLRPIMYASHRDSALMSFYSFLLKKNYEAKIKGAPLEKSVIAYRKIPSPLGGNKSNIDFANDIFRLLQTLDGYTVFCLDIKGYFDNINHRILKEKIKTFSSGIPKDGLDPILKAVTKYRYVYKRDAAKALGNKAWSNPKKYNRQIRDSGLIHHNLKGHGIPQGSPISDILSNIYLYDFDIEVCKLVSAFTYGFYFRYCDDIILAVPKRDARKIYETICEKITESKVDIKKEKTEAFCVDAKKNIFNDITSEFVEEYQKHREFLQYLGFDINLKAIKIRSGTIAGMYRRAARVYYGRHKNMAPRNCFGRYDYLNRSDRRLGGGLPIHQTRKIKKGMKKRFCKAANDIQKNHFQQLIKTEVVKTNHKNIDNQKP